MVVVLILYWATCILALNTTNMIHKHPPTRISPQHLSQRHWTDWNLHLHVALSCHTTLKWKLDLCCSFYLYTIYSAHVRNGISGRMWSDLWEAEWNDLGLLQECCTVEVWGLTLLIFLDCLFEKCICFPGCPASRKYNEILLCLPDLN